MSNPSHFPGSTAHPARFWTASWRRMGLMHLGCILVGLAACGREKNPAPAPAELTVEDLQVVRLDEPPAHATEKAGPVPPRDPSPVPRAAAPPEFPFNALAQESSAHLQAHSRHPIHWRPWNAETLNQARRENRLIFLSIGFFACHVCQLVGREIFTDPEVVAAVRDHFIPVMVDRFERPDLARLYLNFALLTRGQAGWPLQIWLTPDVKPIYASGPTSASRLADTHGQIAEKWKQERRKIEIASARLVELLRTEAAGPGVPQNLPELEPVLHQVFRTLRSTYDERNGGFGGPPKFPQTSTLRLLLKMAVAAPLSAKERAQAKSMAVHSLLSMYRGALHDPLEGGFHRYSLDEFWMRPRFEKLLADQALMIQTGTEAWQLTGHPELKNMIHQTVGYLLRHLRTPDGAFYAAQSAESPDPEMGGLLREGAYYVWSQSQIDRLLGERARFVSLYHGIEPFGNAPPGTDPQGQLRDRNVLGWGQSLNNLADSFAVPVSTARKWLETAHAQMRAERAKRPAPALDPAIWCGWNGLTMGALARAGAVLDQPQWIEAARKIADFGRTHFRDDNGDLRHGASRALPALAHDFSQWIDGLITLHEVTGESAWLEWALELQSLQLRDFQAPGGGLWTTRREQTDLLWRARDEHDGEEPAAASLAAANLIRLAALTGQGRFQQDAAGLIASLRDKWEPDPDAWPMLIRSWLMLNPPMQATRATSEANLETHP